jgi:hypothetical protein
LTDLTAPASDLDAFHRERALSELDIRDLKEGAGMEHCPGQVLVELGLAAVCRRRPRSLRWVQLLGDIDDIDATRLAVARTIRSRFISMPGRLVDRSGRPTLRTPQCRPWRDTFARALDTLRQLSVAVT